MGPGYLLLLPTKSGSYLQLFSSICYDSSNQVKRDLTDSLSANAFNSTEANGRNKDLQYVLAIVSTPLRLSLDVNVTKRFQPNSFKTKKRQKYFWQTCSLYFSAYWIKMFNSFFTKTTTKIGYFIINVSDSAVDLSPIHTRNLAQSKFAEDLQLVIR